MARVRRSELARDIGCSTKTIANAVSAGKIEPNVDYTVGTGRAKEAVHDDSLPKTEAFILKRNPDYYKNKYEQSVGIKESGKTNNDDDGQTQDDQFKQFYQSLDSEDDLSPLPNLRNLSTNDLLQEKIREDIRYRRSQLLVNKIKEKQASGELVPVDTITNILDVYISQYKTGFETEVRRVVLSVCEDYNVNSEDRGKYIKSLNERIENVENSTKDYLLREIKKV